MDQRLQRRRRAARRRQRTGLDSLLSPNLRWTFRYTLLCCQQVKSLLVPLWDFFKDAGRVFKRCTKPDRHEFLRSVLAITVGFLIMGFLGFVIKLMHIPITNIIMG